MLMTPDYKIQEFAKKNGYRAYRDYQDNKCWYMLTKATWFDEVVVAKIGQFSYDNKLHLICNKKEIGETLKEYLKGFITDEYTLMSRSLLHQNWYPIRMVLE